MSTTTAEPQLEQSLLELLGKATGCYLGVAPANGSKPPLLPQPCLQLCVHGESDDAVRGGCSWLLSTLDGEQADTPGAAVCPKGFHAQSTALPHTGSAYDLLILSRPTRSHATDFPAPSLPNEEASADVAAGVLRLCQEQRGMVDEVLQCYEHLHAVFAMSQSLSEISTVPDVYEVVARSLQEHLQAGTCCIATGNPWTFEFSDSEDGDGAGLSRTTLVRLLQARRTPERVEVLSSQDLTALDEQLGDRFSSVMSGPIISDGSERCFVTLFRSNEQTPFSARDSNITESLLRYSAATLRTIRLSERLRMMPAQAE